MFRRGILSLSLVRHTNAQPSNSKRHLRLSCARTFTEIVVPIMEPVADKIADLRGRNELNFVPSWQAASEAVEIVKSGTYS